MTEERTRGAWVRMPDADEMNRAGAGSPYDFGFFPAMGRLIRAHERIAPAFGMLFAQVMFSPEGKLSRAEREMVASVAAAAQDCHY